MIILLHDSPALRRATLTEFEIVRSQDISGDAAISVLLFRSTWIEPILSPDLLYLWHRIPKAVCVEFDIIVQVLVLAFP